MTRAAQQILDQALQLPEKDRDFIAESLWSSLNGSHCADEHEWERQWAVELERRCKEADEGKVEMVPHEEVMATLRAKTETLKSAWPQGLKPGIFCD